MKSNIPGLHRRTYTFFAEETSNLVSNAYNWSFGNGDTSQADFGPAIPEECYLMAFTLTIANGVASARGIYGGAPLTTPDGGVVFADSAVDNGVGLWTPDEPIILPAKTTFSAQTLNASGAVWGGKLAVFLVSTKLYT